jgi:hypothetical protein
VSRWREVAIERLPELKEKIESAATVMALWDEIWFAFRDAYLQDPWNEPLIARVYSYADWCVRAPRNADVGHDPHTAVTVCFYEDIPTFKPARDDMPRWFSYADVLNSKSVFAYGISDDAYAELLAYMGKHRDRYRPRRGI